MRQLFVFDTVDAEDHVAEVACVADDEDSALVMLAAEGFEGSLREVLPLLGAHIGAQLKPAQPAPSDIGPSPLADPHTDESGDDVAPDSSVASRILVATRDFAMLNIYAIGMGVGEVARAVGATPREAAGRLGHHLLGTPSEHPEVDESRMSLTIDGSLATVAHLYEGGMSVEEMAVALGHSQSDVTWALLDSPTRVVEVTRAVLRHARSEVDALRPQA